MTRERKVLAAAITLSAFVAAVSVLGTGATHAPARAMGGLAITLLLSSLAMSPVSAWVSPPSAVALRSARRTLGIAAAVVAIGHALVALPTYLDPIRLGPLLLVPWLRHGVLALGVLATLLVTSFPVLQRALRVRAWSALHRLAYLAAILASLHALAVPFGSAWIGLAACSLTFVLLLARPASLLARRRAEPSNDE